VAIPDSALRRELLGEEAEWGPHEENTARLLEVQAYALDWQWQRETVDPDDPKVRRERMEAKRNGIKPPPRPLIPPVAARPSGMAEKRLTEYLEQVSAHLSPKATRRMVSIEEFNELISAW
jgi:hypothetical protein